MINTLNESSLHKTLKDLYSLNSPGSQKEVKVGSYIADIVEENGDIIEIQTGNLASLLKKCLFYIQEKHKVKIVYPLVTTRYIQTTFTQTGKTSRRKSPKQLNLYSIFRELTALYPLMLNRNFTLEVLEVVVTEERINSGKPEQSQNGRRRFRKEWIKQGKHLDQIGETHVFHGKKSWTSLLPKDLPEVFSARELYELLRNEGKKLSLDEAHLLIWVYSHAGIMEFVEKVSRSNKYSICKNKVRNK